MFDEEDPDCRDDPLEIALESLDFRKNVLEQEAKRAKRSRVAQIEEELEAIEARRGEIQWCHLEPEEFGEPVPCAERRRKVSKPGGLWIETVDTGKKIVSSGWDEAHPDRVERVIAEGGPWSPFVSIRMERLERLTYSLLSHSRRLRARG